MQWRTGVAPVPSVMFIGHFGVALAAKRVAPKTSLGTLILAAQFLDFLWAFFLLRGIEHVRIAPGFTRVSPLDFTDYPISHSLLMATVWALLFGGTYYALRRNARSALVLGAALLSHWVLDFIVHRPDLQLYPGSKVHVGLGLWNSVGGCDPSGSPLLRRRAGDLPQLHPCARLRRTLRILGADCISFLWLGERSICRRPAEGN